MSELTTKTLSLALSPKLVKKLASSKRFMEQLGDWAAANRVIIGFPEGNGDELLFVKERDRLLFEGKWMT